MADRDQILDEIEERYVESPECGECDSFREALNEAYNAGVSAAPQPVKAEQDERERAHLIEGARLLRSDQCVFLETWPEHHAWLEADKKLEAGRARLSAAVEPSADAEEGRR